MTHPADHDELVGRVVSELLETDALTGNHDGTPEHYVVHAENVEYLVRTVLDLYASCQVCGEHIDDHAPCSPVPQLSVPLMPNGGAA